MCSSYWTCPGPSQDASASFGRDLKGGSVGGKTAHVRVFLCKGVLGFSCKHSRKHKKSTNSFWEKDYACKYHRRREKTSRHWAGKWNGGRKSNIGEKERDKWVDSGVVGRKSDRRMGKHCTISTGAFCILFPYEVEGYKCLSKRHLLWRSWPESVSRNTMSIVGFLYLFPSLLLGKGICVVFEFKLRKTSKYITHMPGIHVI